MNNNMDTERRNNIVAVTADDKYCATILETGEIRIMKFNNNKNNLTFDKYLSLENETCNKEKQINRLDRELTNNFKNLCSTLIQGSLAAILFCGLQLVLNDIPTILSMMVKLLTGGIGILSVGMVANISKKLLKLGKKKKNLSQQIEDMDEQLDNAGVSYERVLVPTNETMKSPEACITSIKESASNVVQLLHYYIQTRMKEKADNFKIFYIENDFYDKQLKIKIPMCEDEVKICEKITQSVAKDYTYKTIREDHFPLEKEEQKAYVLKLPF